MTSQNNNGQIKDMNELLQRWAVAGVEAEDQARRVRGMLGQARTLVELAAERVGDLEGAARDAAEGEAFGLIAQMGEYEQGQYQERLAKAMGLNIREYSRRFKAFISEKKKAGAKDAQGEATEFAGGVLGDFQSQHFVELLYDPEELQTRFAVRYPDGRIEETGELSIDGMRYIPVYPNALILKNAVLLPSHLRPVRSTAELVGIIRMFIHRYLDVDEFYERLASYYVLFSWLYDCFQLVPYLRALGDYGTGKTRLLQVVGAVCYRPMFTGGASTTSPIFRMLDKYRGTLILDEADFGRSDEAQDIIKILNTGYMKGVPVLRSVDRGQQGFDIEAYEVYGPKILGTRKRFQDRATESRCLTKEMGGGVPRFDIPIVLPREFWEQAREIRNLLLGYRMKFWTPEMEVDYNAIDRSIEPRLNQVTMAIKTIVDDPQMREEIDEFIREYNRQLIVERSMTLASKVIEAIVAIKNGQPVGYDEDNQPFYDFSLKNVARHVNWIIEGENKEQGEEESEEERAKHKSVGPKRCGEIARNTLQLKTERATKGPIKGNYFVIWDGERVKGLCSRYGIEMNGTFSPPPGERVQEAFDKEREAWKQTGFQVNEGVKE
jgi:hypothetical protein